MSLTLITLLGIVWYTARSPLGFRFTHLLLTLKSAPFRPISSITSLPFVSLSPDQIFTCTLQRYLAISLVYHVPRHFFFYLYHLL
ncbi:hypothetical protein BD560DRAFT_411766 [Blakeslea trispora]|nr:hypothetical protein BD560DRAFT_411766 [Blakeslea trispora]